MQKKGGLALPKTWANFANVEKEAAVIKPLHTHIYIHQACNYTINLKPKPSREQAAFQALK